MLSDPLLCLRSINRLEVILALMCGVRTSHYDEIESLSERRESEEIMMAEVCVGNFAEMYCPQSIVTVQGVLKVNLW